MVPSPHKPDPLKTWGSPYRGPPNSVNWTFALIARERLGFGGATATATPAPGLRGAWLCRPARAAAAAAALPRHRYWTFGKATLRTRMPFSPLAALFSPLHSGQNGGLPVNWFFWPLARGIAPGAGAGSKPW